MPSIICFIQADRTGSNPMARTVDELYSLLVPLNQERMILPRSVVAEVIRYAPLDREAAWPRWLRGTLEWGGRSVPVISFEDLAGLTPAEPGGRTRIAILNGISGGPAPGHFGLLTEGFPQLVRLTREVVQPAQRHHWPEGGPVLCQIRMINEYPLIPDLEAIEAMIGQALSAPGEALI